MLEHIQTDDDAARVAPLLAHVRSALGHTFPAIDVVVMHRGRCRFQGRWRSETAEFVTGQEQGAAGSVGEGLWDLASITKLYTTVLVLQAFSEGVWQPQGLVGDLIPEFLHPAPRAIRDGVNPHTLAPVPFDPQWSGQNVDPAGVTWHHLLSHQSGLHDWLPFFLKLSSPPKALPSGAVEPAMEGAQVPFLDAKGVIQSIIEAGFMDPPGRRLRYSDLNYLLLGFALERQWAQGLDALMHQRIFEPLGLNRTGFVSLRTAVPPDTKGGAVTNPQAMPTEWDARWRQRRVAGEVHDENAWAVGGVAGHAGLFGTALDVAAFGHAWLTRDPRLHVSPAVWTQALQAHSADARNRRGWGVMLNDPSGASCGALWSMDSFGHTGFTGTSLWVDPQSQTVVACLSNAVAFGRGQAMYAFRQALHDRVSQIWCEKA